MAFPIAARFWRWLAVAGVALAGVLIWKTVSVPAVAVHAVGHGALLETVVASGKVRTPQRVEIGGQIAGKVARIPVAEGATVAAGTVLIALDDAELRAAHAQARAARVQAEAKLAQLAALGLPAAGETLAQAEATYRQATRQLARYRDLAQRGFISPAQLDEVERAHEVAHAQLRAARLQVESNRPQGSEHRLAEAALAQARAAEALAAVRLGYATLRAPVAGTLIARAVEVGDVVQPGKALMVLSPAGPTELVVQIDEKNLGRLALGNPALASADAYPERRFPAQVTYINPAVDPLRGSVEVRLRVLQPPAFLRQDMTVSVDIEAARRRGVLVLPIEAVRDAAGDSPWVLRVEGGHARRVAVRLGARGTDRVEVVAGLADGDRVIAAPAGIEPGSRVRAVAPPPMPR
jgi:HlyD family secretion protein